jgi:hypothetical protein
MRHERKPFMPVSNDVDDRLEQLAREKGVGKFEAPAPVAQRAGEGSGLVHAAELRPGPVAPPSGATPRSAMHKINFEAPDYLSTELKINAAHKQTSVRHVIMTALREAGFTIKDIDMIEDGRRLRGSNKLH